MRNDALLRPLALVTGTLLVLPSLYFIVSASLEYGPGLPGLWKVIIPIFEEQESRTFGFNINLLILFGPLVALLINVGQVIKLDMLNNKEELNLQFVFQKYSLNWLVVAASSFCLSALCLYLIAENVFY